MTVDEGLASDDTTVREIPGAISIYLIEFKISLPLPINPLFHPGACGPGDENAIP